MTAHPHPHPERALPRAKVAPAVSSQAGGRDYLEARVTRLVLLYDLHAAKKAHRATAGIRRRLRDVTVGVL